MPVGSPDEGSHKGGSQTEGVLNRWRTHTTMGTSMYVKISSFSFLHSFLLGFFEIS